MARSLSYFVAELVAALSRRPLIPIAGAFALGILMSGSPVILFTMTLAAFGCAVVVWRTRTRDWAGAALLLAFCAAGGWRAVVARAPAPDDIVHLVGPGLVTLAGTVAGDVETTRDAWTCNLCVTSASVAGGPMARCSGQVAARLRRDDGARIPDIGDVIEAHGRLELPAPATNPGGFDYAAYLAARGVFTIFSTRRAGAWHLARRFPSAGDVLDRVASWSRRSLEDKLGRLLPPTEAGVLAGIMIGTRRALPPQLDDDFAATGTAHILATAGLHVGLVAGLIFGGLRLCRFGRKPACILTILLLVFYALLAGMRPSVVRAVLMAELFLFGILLDRESDTPTALAAASILLLAVQPGYLYDAGFELSFATVGTIIAILGVTQPCLDRLRSTVVGPTSRGRRTASALVYSVSCLIVLTAAAQVGSAPLVAQYYNQLSLIGIVANVLIVPVLTCLLGAGFAIWLASLVWPAGAHWIASFALSPLLAYIVGAARACVHIPLAVLFVPSPGWLLIGWYYTSLAACIMMLRASQRRRTTMQRMPIAEPAQHEAAMP